MIVKAMSFRDRVLQRARERTVGVNYLNVGDHPFFKPEAPKAGARQPFQRMDFIPYLVSVPNHPEGVPTGDYWWRRQFKVHRDIGPAKQRFICPTIANRPCPICEDLERMASDPNASDEVMDALRAKDREVYNVIDADHPELGVQVFEHSAFLFGKPLDLELNTGDPANGDFPSPIGGRTLHVRFTEQKSGTYTFMEATRFDFVPREDITEDWLQLALDLDAILIIPTYEELQAAYLGAEAEVATAAAPVPSRPAPRAPAAPAGGRPAAPARRPAAPVPPALAPTEEQPAGTEGEEAVAAEVEGVAESEAVATEVETAPPPPPARPAAKPAPAVARSVMPARPAAPPRPVAPPPTEALDDTPPPARTSVPPIRRPGTAVAPAAPVRPAAGAPPVPRTAAPVAPVKPGAVRRPPPPPEQ